MAHPELAPRTNHGYELYKAATGTMLDAAHRIADIGAGDSNFAEVANRKGHEVHRFDAQYADSPPIGDAPYRAVDSREMDEVPSESFDAAVSMFMMQHLNHGTGDIARAISEMIRITKTAEHDDPTAGTIVIYPVWHQKSLQKTIQKGFSRYASVGYPDSTELEQFSSEYVRPSLLIRKTADLNEQVVQSLASAIEASNGLRKSLSPIDLGRRAVIRATGNTLRNTPTSRIH